jgi:hypothetical protein
VTTSRRPNGDEFRELFARFGRAYYFADVLHRGVLNLCALCRVSDRGPVTRLRVEEHLRDAFKLTLGQAMTLVRSHFASSVAEQLEEAVERRNFLAHHFWYERAHLMVSADGVEEMTSELDTLADLFERLDAEVETVFAPLLARLNVTPEMLASSLDEVMRGEPMEPLPQTRKPKKEEVVVGVYNAPSVNTPGKSVLVFETEDGVVWQLCDAGFGWSPYESVDSNWERVAKFADLLPARIDPRPGVAAPWTFDLVFGKKATLEVRLGPRTGEVLYKLKRIPRK